MRPTTDTQREAKRAEMQQQMDNYLRTGGRIYQAAPGESGAKTMYNGNPPRERIKRDARAKSNG